MAERVFKDFKEMFAYVRGKNEPSKLKEVEEKPKKKTAKKASKKK